MSAAEERLANDPSSELWGEHRSRYRFAIGLGLAGDWPGERAAPAQLHTRCTDRVEETFDANPRSVRRGDAQARGDAQSRGDALARGDVLAKDDAQARGDAPARHDVLGRGDAQARGDALARGDVLARGDAQARGDVLALAGLAVLDVACGAGFGLQMLRDAGAHAIGVDYDATALSDVRQRHRAAPLVRGDATRLPLEDASFNLVVSFETIEHVPDATALVREIRRVLKPGGRLVLSTPNRAFGPPERHTDNPFHVREFTADELRDTLRAAFDNVQLYGQRPSQAYRYVPFLMLEPQYEPSALAWKLLVRLRYGLRDRLAHAISGRSFYPGEEDYWFDPAHTDGAHALVAVAT